VIIGIGADLCDIRRIEKTLERFGPRFVARVFTETEQARSDRRQSRAASYAKRFAAKEACAKALGTGLRMGTAWQDMGVVNRRSGQPTMVLQGGALERLRALTPPNHETVIHLTITDDHPYAQAFVVIEAIPLAMPPSAAAAQQPMADALPAPGQTAISHHSSPSGTKSGNVMTDRVESRVAQKNDGGILETIKVIAQALLIALVVRTFLFQPFNIPSGSLVPTLLVGDYLFVSKYTYGYSKHSFPFSAGPLGSYFPKTRIWGAEPKRGEIAVFKLPKDGETDYIKRVIGLPGDRIQMIKGILHINGSAVKREADGTYDTTDSAGKVTKTLRYQETLPNGVRHVIIEREGDSGFYDNTNEYQVPPGHYFMMGDNRDNSTDSRALDQVGYVPLENFVGRGEVIFFSLKDDEQADQTENRFVRMVSWIWDWKRLRTERLFQSVK
jgi:signal peptidase I